MDCRAVTVRDAPLRCTFPSPEDSDEQLPHLAVRVHRPKVLARPTAAAPAGKFAADTEVPT